MTEKELRWAKEQFERTWPWLAAALARQPYVTHEKHHIWEAIEQDRVQLWPTPHSAVLTDINTYPSGLKIINCWLAGGDLNELKQTLVRIERFAAGIGCNAVGIVGRRGWVRALDGFKEAGMAVVKELG